MLKRWPWWLAAILVLLPMMMGQSGCELPWVKPPPVVSSGLVVNIQVDAELEDVDGLNKLVNELKARGITTTIYVTADYANVNGMLITNLYRDGFEIALHGFHSAEQVATMTYEEQLDLLTRAKTAIEGCQQCGTHRPITGFRPQYFSQNEDTYKVLETLGIEYNSGFKAAQLAMPGHEADYGPYEVSGEGYDFTVVPFTTVAWNDKTVYLCDLAAGSAEMMTGEQWGQVLQDGIDEAIANDRPFIALFHGYYSGVAEHTDYFDAFVAVLDRLETEGATFVTSSELVAEYAQ